jgi:uroporphyrinogen III methyltransferase / synthase
LNTVKSRTLEGRRIVITRAAEQAKELRERLEELGAEVLSLPLIRFLEVENKSDLDRAIRSLGDFDWLIFTSTNAVTFFLERCRALGVPTNSVSPKIAAVGRATESALNGEALSASLVPAEFNGAALAREFGPAIAGRTVLLPRSDRAGEELPAALRRVGATVTEVIAYRTAGPDKFDQRLVQAIRDGQVDAVTFFSPSAFREFRNLMDTASFRNLSSRLAFAAVGPVTAEAIRGAGLPVAIEAGEATVASLIAALERHFAALEIGQSQTTNRVSR